ncbi:MAG: MlaA family lipoprotein [Shimia sp.]
MTSANATLTRLSFLAAALALAGCAAPQPTGINDPFEQTNRRIHEFNKQLDSKALRPASQSYGRDVPNAIQQGVVNFAENVELPAVIVNNALQGDLVALTGNSFRFLINTTFGLLGFVDTSDVIGLEVQDTDFGATLHRWGAPEGPYVELPLLGPSTGRDAVGEVVDAFLNPLSYMLPTPEAYAPTVADTGDLLTQRFRFTNTIDSLLYESVDSYSQTRISYLQNRRFELGQRSGAGTGDAGDVFGLDPFADPYATGTPVPPSDPVGGAAPAAVPVSVADPAFDPYADPYAQ